MPLLTPEGKAAGLVDKIMLLAMWDKKLREEKYFTKPPIAAGMGKPTFPISQFAVHAGQKYWSDAGEKSQKARHLLSGGVDTSEAKIHNQIATSGAAIDYGNPRGDLEARTTMAKALTRWYGNNIQIEPQHVLFTVGGAGALHSIFTVVSQQSPKGFIVTPFPHYSLYTGPQGQNRLYPIHLLKEKGYQLTAEAVEKALQGATEKARLEGVKVNAFLMCDPNNPLGTALEEKELQKISNVLEKYPNIKIILDEAYGEMRWNGKHSLSILSCNPKLKDRIILMRSATKALSAAGERMAVAVAFDEAVIASLTQININIYGHAPRSSQVIFAGAMESLDSVELTNLRKYYQPQVNYVAERLKNMGAALPDPNYKPEGAFYVVADLKDLFGQQISKDASRALGKTGVISTDEELIYSLLFDDAVMIAPLSYFGVSNRHGFVRITCSGGEHELNELMNRLEERLVIARKEKQTKFQSQINETLDKLEKFDEKKSAAIKKTVSSILDEQKNSEKITALALKDNNQKLNKILHTARLALADFLDIKNPAATKIQSVFRGFAARKKFKLELASEWNKSLSSVFKKPPQECLEYSSTSERCNFVPWGSKVQGVGEKTKKSLEVKAVVGTTKNSASLVVKLNR